MGTGPALLTIGPQVTAVYRQLMEEKAIGMPLVRSMIYSSHRVEIPGLSAIRGEKPFVHVFVAAPIGAKRILLINPGAGADFSIHISLVKLALEQGSAVVYVENLGHGAASPFCWPLTTEAMGLGVQAVYGAMKAILKLHPSLRRKPICEWNISMGGGNAFTAHQNLGLKIPTVETPWGLQQIRRIFMMSPRLQLNHQQPRYSWPMRKIVAPVLQGLLIVFRGLFERLVRPLVQWPEHMPGVKPGSDEGKRMVEAAQRGHRRRGLPLAYGVTVFGHDERALRKTWAIPPQSSGIEYLWGICPSDKEVNSGVNARVALHVGGPGSKVIRLPYHDPSWAPEELPAIVHAAHAFFDGLEHEHLLPNVPETYRALGLHGAGPSV